MIGKLDKFGIASVLFCLLSVIFSLSINESGAKIYWTDYSPLSSAAILTTSFGAIMLMLRGVRSASGGVIFLGFVLVGIIASYNLLYGHPDIKGSAQPGFWFFVFALWALAWRGIDAIAEYTTLNKTKQRSVNLLVPVVFGLWLLFIWEVICAGFGVPQVLLPTPSAVAVRFMGSIPILWDDFYQTFLKAVLAGYIIGCASGFAVSIMVDRVPFLRRGLLPFGNMISALPIVGIAPIMVMWFGFDWQSKAAVVVIMTFFPMLVNTVSGLAASDALERELLRSYGASYFQTLVKLRLPAAMPFIFNALKINSTLALIGAIVAEFFGTPIVGMGFRISTEVGRMNVDMVWAEIIVAALAGSAFYGAISIIERITTFWHPSVRQRI